MLAANVLDMQWSRFENDADRMDGVSYLNLDDSEALIRHQGGYILGSRVQTNPLLASPGLNPYSPDLGLPEGIPDKFDATHSASPADTMPGQTIRPHGDSRFTLYQQIDKPRDDVLVLRGIDQAQRLQHKKIFRMLPNGLAVIDNLTNIAPVTPNVPVEPNAVRTSLLEHFYIPVAEDDIAGIKILDDDGRPSQVKLQPEKGQALRGSFADIADGLAKGETYLHEQFFYSTRSFEFPDGRRITIGAEGQASDSPNAGTALAFWRRPGTNSICIEPMTGVRINGKDNGTQNNTIYIPPKGFLQLTSSIQIEGISG